MEKNMNLQDMLNLLGKTYEREMPFNRLLGIRIVSLTPDDIRVRIDMREELIGNFARRILHGGVISAVLDLTGGLIAFAEMVKHHEAMSADEMARRFAKSGTIDMRVDYLRKGEGDYFIASGSVLRRGNKVTVIRMELLNDKNLLIAAGTGTYLII